MALLDDLGKVVQARVNRTNPAASIQRTSSDKKDDWLGNTLRRLQQAAIEREQREQRKREAEALRSRFTSADQNRGSNFGASSNVRDNRRGEFIRQESERATAERTPLEQWLYSGAGLKFLGRDVPKQDEVKADPYSALLRSGTVREFLPKGKGMDSKEEWQAFANEMASRGMPESVFRGLVEHMGTEKGAEAYKPIGEHDYRGPVYEITKDLTGNELVANLASGASKVVPVLGAFEASSEIDPNASMNEVMLGAAGYGLDAAILGKGGRLLEDALVGKALSKAGLGGVKPVLNKSGKLTGFEVFRKEGLGVKGKALEAALRAASRGGINIAEDVPVNAIQMMAQGASFEDALKLATVGNGDLATNPILMSGGIGGTASLGGSALSLGRGRALKKAAVGAGIGLAQSELREHVLGDENSAKWAALMGAGGMLALHAGQKLGGRDPRRTGLTEEFYPGERLFHGTNWEIEGGVPTRGNGTGGKGAYVTPDVDNAATYGDTIYEVTPQGKPIRALSLPEKLDADEPTAIMHALPPEKRLPFIRYLADSDQTGNDLLRAIEHVGEDVDGTLQKAGWNATGWSSIGADSDIMDELVVKEPGLLAPVAKHNAEDVVGNWLMPSQAANSGIGRELAQAGAAGVAGGVMADGDFEERLKAGLGTAGISLLGKRLPGVVDDPRIAKMVDDGFDSRFEVDDPRAPLRGDVYSQDLAAGPHGVDAPTPPRAPKLNIGKADDPRLGYPSGTSPTPRGYEAGEEMAAGWIDPNSRSMADVANENYQKWVDENFNYNPTAAQRAAQAKAARDKLRAEGAQVAADAQERATPPVQVLEEFKAETAEFMESAKIQMDDPRVFARILDKLGLGEGSKRGSIGRAINPAIAATTAGAKHVQTAIVASANYLEKAAGMQSIKARTMLDALRPLMDEGGPRVRKGPIDISLHDLGRAGQQLGGAGAVAGAGVAASEITGDERYAEGGALAALTTLGAISARQHATRYASGPWDKIKLKPDSWAGAVLSPKQMSGIGKLRDIIQHPDQYELTPEQQLAVQQFRNLNDQLVMETNGAILSSGSQDIIPLMETHGLFQFFTPESVAKVLEQEKPSGYRMLTPGFDRKRGSQIQRKLGADDREALMKYGDLEFIKNPMDLFKQQIKYHDQIRSTAMLVSNLKEAEGLAVPVPRPSDLKGMSRADRKAVRDQIHTLSKTEGWAALPGIDDYLFHPDVIREVDRTLIPSPGREGGFLHMLDAMTNFSRQLMFVGDASAWSMQGAMLAIAQPAATIRNAHHLVGATVFGERYFEQWIKNNKELWERYTKAGGRGGREHGGLELSTFSPGKLPGLRSVESHGFDAFLPMHRALMFDAASRVEAWVDRASLTKKGKFEIGTSRLIAELIENSDLAPLAVAGAAVATGNELELTGDEKLDAVFTLALGGGATAAMMGTRVVERIAPKSTLADDVLAAKATNRTSGVLNRQQLGMSAEQAQVERTLFMRSPALTRNALILAKHALTDFGPEGAMSRFYLIKTAAIVGTGLVALKLATTGEMDSFDPTDPESVFSPEGLMRANNGVLGNLSPSNPLISLARAFVKTDQPDGERRWRFDGWEAAVGMADWYASRTPDITGMLTNPGIQYGAREAFHSDTEPYQQSLPSPLPVSAQSLFETGAVQSTGLGKLAEPLTDALPFGLQANPDYNHDSERLAGVAGSFAGLNVNPETRGRERIRLREDVMRDLGITDRNGDGVLNYQDDLNAEQKAMVNSDPRLGPDSQFAKLTEETSAEHEASPVDAYYTDLNDVTARWVEGLMEAQQLVEDGQMSLPDFRKEYQRLSDVKRTESAQAKRSLGALSAGTRGRDETVDEFIARNTRPEDAAVSAYYDLFEQATTRGQLDFQKLERLQNDYWSSLDADTRAYVERRLAATGEKPAATSLVGEMKSVQAAVRPYFQLRDELFKEFRDDSQIMSQYASLDDFEAEVAQMAIQYGISEDDVLSLLSQRDRGLRLYQRNLRRSEQNMRRSDPLLDKQLSDWYGYTPMNRENQRAQRLKDRAARTGIRGKFKSAR